MTPFFSKSKPGLERTIAFSCEGSPKNIGYAAPERSIQSEKLPEAWEATPINL